jgi:hypothetical protein
MLWEYGEEKPAEMSLAAINIPGNRIAKCSGITECMQE